MSDEFTTIMTILFSIALFVYLVVSSVNLVLYSDFQKECLRTGNCFYDEHHVLKFKDRTKSLDRSVGEEADE